MQQIKNIINKLLFVVLLRGSSVPIEEQASFPKAEKDELENNLRNLLLEDNCDGEQIYRDCYENLHQFVLKHAQSQQDHVYSANMKRYVPICKLIGSGKRVIEIGCGEGILSMAIAKVGNYVIGTDVSESIINLAEKAREKENITNVSFKLIAGSRKLPFSSNTYDCVISKSVFEHFRPKDVYIHLNEVKRLLKAGSGCYFLIVPHKRFGYAKGLHLKLYTYRELNKILSETGFSVLRCPIFPLIFQFNFLVPISYKISLEKRLHRLRIPELLWLLLGLEPIMIIARKPSIEYSKDEINI